MKIDLVKLTEIYGLAQIVENNPASTQSELYLAKCIMLLAEMINQS